MNIVFGIDKNFALGMGVLMVSILENNREKESSFHVFTDGLTEEDLVKLEALGDKYSTCSINIYYMDRNFFRNLPAWYIWTLAVWYRLIAPIELLGKVKYLWYLDSDIICINKIGDITLKDDMILAAEGSEAKGEEAIRVKRFLENALIRVLIVVYYT